MLLFSVFILLFGLYCEEGANGETILLAFYAFFCPSPCPLGPFVPSCRSSPLGSLEQVRLLIAIPPQLHSTFIPSIEEALLNV